MKIVSWSIVLDEISFIKDLVEYHLPFLDGMYFLDTGSTDGTLEYLQGLAKENSKIIVEEYHTKFKSQYNVEWEKTDDSFPESEVRNHAIQRCEELLKPDWLIQIDGDEVFLMPQTVKLIEKYKDKDCISISTINSFEYLDKHPIEMRNGIKMWDPHCRVWKSGKGFRYEKNPRVQAAYHCIPCFNGKHLYHHPNNVFDGKILMFHLHWAYGKKVEKFFANRGITNKQDIVKTQTINEFGLFLPKCFWDKRKAWINGEI